MAPNMRAIDRVRAKIAGYHTAVRELAEETADLQRICKHTWILHSQRLKNQESKKWWVHRTCTTCHFPDTKLEDVPICPHCFLSLVAVESDDVAAEVKKMALAEDPYATIAFAFACTKCGGLHGFAFRDKEKKI